MSLDIAEVNVGDEIVHDLGARSVITAIGQTTFLHRPDPLGLERIGSPENWSLVTPELLDLNQVYFINRQGNLTRSDFTEPPLGAAFVRITAYERVVP